MPSDEEATNQAALFERIGGKPAVNAAVDLFYEKILADPRVSEFFEGVDIERQKAKQKGFLTMAFGGPTQYTGRALREAHAPLVERGLRDVHVDVVAELLGATLDELGVAAQERDEALAIANSVRDEVLDR